MKYCPQDVTLFLQEHGRVFPYSDILKTRRRFYTGWLLMEEPARGANMTPWCRAVPSSLFSQDTSTHLLVTMQALPATPVMSEILDVRMDCWGRKNCNMWYQSVLQYLVSLCKSPTAMTVSQYDIMHRCIGYRIESLSTECFGRTLSFSEYMTLMDAWSLSFDMDYYAEGTPKQNQFFKLAVRSFHFVRDVADEERASAAASAAGAFTPDVAPSSSTSSSSVALVSP